MARSMEIPAVVGTKVVMEKIQNGDIVIIDGLDGSNCKPIRRNSSFV